MVGVSGGETEIIGKQLQTPGLGEVANALECLVTHNVVTLILPRYAFVVRKLVASGYVILNWNNQIVTRKTFLITNLKFSKLHLIR